MIDLVTVRKLQVERINMQVEADRKSKLATHKYLSEKQKANFIEAEADMEKAEKDFPKFLETVEERIAARIDAGATSYSHQLVGTVRETYLVKMLLDVLPLHGFICKFDENKLNISW